MTLREDNDQQFGKLVEPHRSRLRLHCYRMLGSSHDADDMVQETMTRAFRSRESLESEETVRPWLYRIATNVCLDELQKRPKTRARGPELGPPHDPTIVPTDARPEEEWIEPAPSAWMIENEALTPAAQVTMKESVALAFVAALQVLTPPQRAVLLLRDVVGLSAEETATALESTVSAANSTLHRARVALEERVGPRADWSPEKEAVAVVDRALLERYVRAWESGDLANIIALLHEEATISMPPLVAWYEGRDAVATFFGTRLRPLLDARVFRGRVVEANGRLAVAFYRIHDPASGKAELHALNVIETRGGLITFMDHFMTKSALTAFVSSLGVETSLDL